MTGTYLAITNRDMDSHSTIRVILLTPPGRGAVATVRIEGPGAVDRVDSHFQSPANRPVADLPGNRLAFGRFQLGTDVYEEVIVRRSGKDSVEIHCHSGPAVVERLIAVLTEEPGERIPANEWLQKTHSRPIAAAAHAALGNATTLRAATILLDQFHGALDQALRNTLKLLDCDEIDLAADMIQQLLALAPCGCHLQQPWRVALAGHPNVGKSSLMNALLGYGRAIVHETPGTTRDLVTATTALDGWPVEFCDTAGLRDAEHVIEQHGIGLARQQLESASLAILVFDATVPWSVADADLSRLWPDALLVFNKIDLPDASLHGRPPGQPVSAITAQGIETLIDSIVHRLVPNPPNPQQAVPFLEEHVTALEAAAAAIESEQPAQAACRLADLLS